MTDTLKAPFPWFGGKSRVAGIVWQRFGDVRNYVEPFFGSGAVLLGRPSSPQIETVNDLDGFVANFWRATQRDPEAVAQFAWNPVNENDLHARHVWLIGQASSLSRKLEGNPDWYDAKIAGYWVWGVSCWIGGGFCFGKGSWYVDEGGLLVKGGDGRGVRRNRPHLSCAGLGVNRKLPHLSGDGLGVNRNLPHLSGAGRGVNRKRLYLGDAGRRDSLIAYFERLRDRMGGVRVASGNWSRVCGPAVTHRQGMTGVFLDPPYADTANRDPALYRVDSSTVAHDVREWAILNGENPKMRIALCGYVGEHTMPPSWECVSWKANGGYANQKPGPNENATRERIWFSPACLSGDSGSIA